MLFKADFKPRDAGFTFKQNSGSIKISLMVIGLLLLFRYYLSFLLGSDDGSRDPEELLFIATMHGIDHESLYRGVLLYTLSLGIISTRYIIFDAKIGIAGILLVVLFALAHGVQYRGDGWFFFPTSLFFTGLHGLVYLWMRERTGSLFFPIIAQNAVIIFGQLLG
ncbi:MAG: membrane protease YdiL (CAAX protease family) [Phenylobacterium sp.]|jgi:membrane protease YdiL (CAAX protease family)